MMRNGDNYAVGVRRETGEISIAKDTFVSVRKKHKILDLPIIRGSVNMVESMMLSFRTLETSAEQFGIEEETSAETTKKAAQTTAPATTTADTSAATTEEGGCGSAIGGVVAMVSILGMGAVALRKKEN